MTDFVELIKLNNKDGYSRAIHVETFILNLLSHHAAESKKKFSVNYGFTSSKHNHYQFNFDGIAPDGIDDMQGPLLVEIKYRINIDTITKMKAVLEKIRKEYSFLLIVPDEIDPKSLKKIKDTLDIFISNKSYEIWDNNRIKELTNLYPTKSKEIFENLGYIVLKRAGEIGELKQNWNKLQQESILTLKTEYQNDRLFLFLGAGVSIDAGVPGWTNLLEQLNVAILQKSMTIEITKEESEILSKTLSKIHSDSPLIKASYIKQALNEKFIDEIGEVMYKSVKPLKQQEQLRAIAKSSMPVRGKFGLRGVITYNFDDLLEKQLQELGISHTSIYSEGSTENFDKLPIYHVHGFIPEEPQLYENLDNSNLVFSEDGYHLLQNDPYSWSNLIQLRALQEYSVLMIGLSGIDPNLRRLLSIFAKRNDNKKHHILLRRELQAKPKELSKKNFDKFEKLHHGIIEATFQEIGVNIIWYKNFEDIKDIIAQITDK